MRALLPALILAFISPEMALSDQADSPTCNMSRETFEARMDDFVGVWSVSMLEGWLETQHFSTSIPGVGESDTLTTFAFDGELVGENLKTPGTYVMEYFEGGEWQFDMAYAELMPFNYGLALLMNRPLEGDCDPTDMLQLQAEGIVTDPVNGGDIHFVTRFYFVDLHIASGVTIGEFESPQGPMRATRTFIMSLE